MTTVKSDFARGNSTLPQAIVQYSRRADLARYYSNLAPTSPQTSLLFKRLRNELLLPRCTGHNRERYVELHRAYHCCEDFRFEEAQQIFQSLFFKHYEPAYYQAARLLALTGDFNKAFLIANQAFVIDSRENTLVMWRLLLLLGEKLGLSSDSIYALVDEMKARCQKEEALEEQRWMLDYMRAEYAFRRGDYEKTREGYSEATGYKGAARYFWAFAFKKVLAYPTHEERLQAYEMLKTHAGFSEIKKTRTLLLKAEMEELLGLTYNAHETLQRVLKDPVGYYLWKAKLAFFYFDLRNSVSRFDEYLLRATERWPSNGLFWQLRIQHVHLNAKEEVEKILEEALKNAPRSPEVYCEYARYLYCIHQDVSLGKKYVEMAISLDPRYGDAYIEKARLEIAEKGDNADLNPIIAEVTAKQPSHGYLWKLFSKEPFPTPGEVITAAVEHLRSFDTLTNMDSFLYLPLYNKAKEGGKSLNSFIQSPLVN